MLQTFNNAAQTLAAGSDVIFGQNTIQRGYTVTHTQGDTDIHLNAPGIYKIEFDAVVTSTEEAPATVILSMYNNGEQVDGAYVKTTPQTNTDLRSVSFTTLVRVPRSCCIVNNNGNITIKSTNAAQITYANLVATRISN